MNRHIFACSTASVLALTLGIAAQTPPATGAQAPPQAPGAAASAATATVEGCIMKESDVRKTNVVEKIPGTGDNYILAAAKVLKGTAPASAASTAPPAPTATTGTTAAAAGMMFDVKGLDGDRLKGFAGKRVEIDGTFADTSRSSAAGATEDLVDLRATAIRASSSTAACPAAR
jgi:hypothetical protein